MSSNPSVSQEPLGQLKVGGIGGGDGGSDVYVEQKVIMALIKELSDIDTEIPKLEAALATHDKSLQYLEGWIASNPSVAHYIQASLDSLRNDIIPAAKTKLTEQRTLCNDKAKELVDAKAALKKAKDDMKKRHPSSDLGNPPKRKKTGIKSQEAMTALKTLDPSSDSFYRGLFLTGIHFIQVDHETMEPLNVSFADKLRAIGFSSCAPQTAARDITKVKAFLKPLCKTLPGHIDDMISNAPSEATGDEYRDYLTDMVGATTELHQAVMPAVSELCDYLEVVTRDQHDTGLHVLLQVGSLVKGYGHKGFMEAAMDIYGMPAPPYSGDHDGPYMNAILKGELESQYPGSQKWMWAEVTKTVLVALRACFAMSLLTRSLLITEDRVVDVPDEKRAIWTGVDILQEMLDLFGLMCTEATEFVKDSQNGVVVYMFPEAMLDDPFIDALLGPVIAELAPDPPPAPRSLPLRCSTRKMTAGKRWCAPCRRPHLLLLDGQHHGDIGVDKPPSLTMMMAVFVYDRHHPKLRWRHDAEIPRDQKQSRA